MRDWRALTWPRPAKCSSARTSAGPDGAVGLHRRRRARCHARRHAARPSPLPLPPRLQRLGTRRHRPRRRELHGPGREPAERLGRLGGVPSEHRTDSLSAAFRNLATTSRPSTERYEAFCAHYSMRPSRNNPGEAHENGTIEAAHAPPQGRLDQASILRGSPRLRPTWPTSAGSWTRSSTAATAAASRVRPRSRRCGRCPFGAPPTSPSRPPAVTRNATITVDKVSLQRAVAPDRSSSQGASLRRPAGRVPGRRSRAQLSRVCAPSAPGAAQVIDYHHVIASLRRKPQALRHLAYREALFPRAEYRRAWQAIDGALPETSACRLMVGLL